MIFLLFLMTMFVGSTLGFCADEDPYYISGIYDEKYRELYWNGLHYDFRSPSTRGIEIVPVADGMALELIKQHLQEKHNETIARCLEGHSQRVSRSDKSLFMEGHYIEDVNVRTPQRCADLFWTGKQYVWSVRRVNSTSSHHTDDPITDEIAWEHIRQKFVKDHQEKIAEATQSHADRLLFAQQRKKEEEQKNRALAVMSISASSKILSVPTTVVQAVKIEQAESTQNRPGVHQDQVVKKPTKTLSSNPHLMAGDFASRAFSSWY